MSEYRGEFKLEVKGEAMTDKPNLPSHEELWEMVQTFSQHAARLKGLLEAEREKNTALNSENSGWLAVYQRLQSEIAGLKAELSRLESRIREQQGES